MIDQIEELNVRMSEIGLEDDCVDTEALRDKYFGNGAEEDVNEAPKEEPHESNEQKETVEKQENEEGQIEGEEEEEKEE